jgi:plastocyanin
MSNLFCLLVLVCLFGVSACSNKQETNGTPAENSKPAVFIDPATATTITGHIKFEGTAPKPQKIDMAQDPGCGNKPTFDESFAVNKNGDLANVFVYVKNPFPNKSVGGWISGGPVIKQQGCRYEPHVLGAMVGQPVRIINADDTTHNIHPMPTASKPWNESQLPKAEPIVKKFDKPEIMIPIKCNQHPWMRMYLNVTDHPFFAVSDQDGHFEIGGLPPGEYTLAAVHEKLGEKTTKIVVRPKESKTADFTFTAK